jgi:hypothetical protein
LASISRHHQVDLFDWSLDHDPGSQSRPDRLFVHRFSDLGFGNKPGQISLAAVNNRLAPALACADAGEGQVKPSNHWGKKLERVPGIEPGYSAWKAAALPLSYTRADPEYTIRAAEGRGWGLVDTFRTQPEMRLIVLNLRTLILNKSLASR